MDENSDSDEELKSGEVDLGFPEPVDHEWQLHRCYFPSKIGGKPAWLNPQNLPPITELQCSSCNAPCKFLLQVYAPRENCEQAFHRTLFLFCCTNKDCYKHNSNDPFIIFRCQLERDNIFYSKDPPNYDDSEFIKTVKDDFGNLCEICGCLGPKKCSRCKKVGYCSKIHQVLDWKVHKQSCSNESTSNIKQQSTSSSTGHDFPVYEIVIEPESHSTIEDSKSNSDINEIKQSGLKYSISELEQFASASKNSDDKYFETFRELMSGNPEQILRYHKDGQPLWCASEGQLANDKIPKCENCKGDRTFEFQVMPQLLNHLQVDNTLDAGIDWGVLAVYTCKENCKIDGNGYVKEIVHKQDFSNITNDKS